MMPIVELLGGVPTIDLAGPAASAPIADYAAQASAAIAEHGCVRLLGAFTAAQVATFRRENDVKNARYFPQAQYGDARDQGDRRTLITIEIDGGYGTPDFYANDRIYPIAEKTLGKDFILGHLAVILSRPGSEDQFVHRDTPSLFGDASYDAFMPTVGVAMVLPLMELGQVNGGTRVWPGTHRVASDDEAREMPSVVVTLPLGACLLFDVRLMHGGKGNRSDQMRSIVYGAYHRKWFRDWDGFEYQAPIGISRAKLREVPDRLKHLFAWRFDRYGSWWRRSLVERALGYLPAPLERSARRVLKSD